MLNLVERKETAGFERLITEAMFFVNTYGFLINTSNLKLIFRTRAKQVVISDYSVIYGYQIERPRDE